MNPKDAQGASKPNLSRIPLRPLLETAAALEEGAQKYGPWNWRDEKVSETIYVDAAIRHLVQFLSGEDIDQDSGLPHIVKAIAGLLIIRDAQVHGCSIDTRQVDQNLNMDGIRDHILSISEKYPSVEEKPASEGCLISPDDVGGRALTRAGDIVQIVDYNEYSDWPVSFRLASQGESAAVLTATKFGQYEVNATSAAYKPKLQSEFDIVKLLDRGEEPAPEGCLITPDDVGKRAKTRGGDIVQIFTYNEKSYWPFSYRFADRADTVVGVSVTKWGQSSNEATGSFYNPELERPTDIVELYDFDNAPDPNGCLITPEDVGKLGLTRGGESLTILDYQEGNNWPVYIRVFNSDGRSFTATTTKYGQFDHRASNTRYDNKCCSPNDIILVSDQ